MTQDPDQQHQPDVEEASADEGLPTAPARQTEDPDDDGSATEPDGAGVTARHTGDLDHDSLVQHGPPSSGSDAPIVPGESSGG